MREIAEILDHWQHGRSVTAIAESLDLDRKTVRKYVGLASQAGFVPGQAPPEGWGRWLPSPTGAHREGTAPADGEHARCRSTRRSANSWTR